MTSPDQLTPTARPAVERDRTDTRAALALRVENSQLRDLLRRWVDVFGRELKPESALMRDTRAAGVTQ